MNIPKKGPHKIPKLYQNWYEVAEHFKGKKLDQVTHRQVLGHTVIYVYNRDQRGVISKALRKAFGSRWNKSPYDWEYISSKRRDTGEPGATPIYDGYTTARQLTEVCYWVKRISAADGWDCPCEAYGETENLVDYEEQEKDFAELVKRFGEVR